ncbi:MAG: hypothetical protein COX48_02265 [bacterium (Candidatus Stahlbacteria) CG23_combo_of_CG06-09_8_20_14_all_34_7]|nr:MAG: hypothetical protein COX48_02265 [bacterium (Candidatus Stahlbacteria) CG23_combo_of_CG06-09_8_20_14_all_34_7]
MKTIKVTSVYEGENINSGYQSITFRFNVGSNKRTLSAEDLTDFQDKFISHLEKINYKLR